MKDLDICDEMRNNRISLLLLCSESLLAVVSKHSDVEGE